MLSEELACQFTRWDNDKSKSGSEINFSPYINTEPSMHIRRINKLITERNCSWVQTYYNLSTSATRIIYQELVALNKHMFTQQTYLEHLLKQSADARNYT